MTTPDVATSQSAESERAIGTRLFNQVWEYMLSPDRTQDDDDIMLHMAHASRFHWGNAGGPEHRARGEWQCSRVYAILGRAEPSAHHAGRVLAICRQHDIGDWDLAFAYEALARASAVAGHASRTREFTEQALLAAEHIADSEDRELLLADLETIPGQARFW